MAYKVKGKQLSASAASLAKDALGIYPNWFRGNRKKYSREYWAKVVNHLGKLYKIGEPIVLRVR